MATKSAADADRQAAAQRAAAVQRASSPLRSRIVPIAVGVVVLCAALAIAISVAGDGGSRPDALEDEAVRVAVTGTPLPSFPEAGADDDAVGTPFPTLAGTGADGEPLTIEPGQEPMLVVYLTHWCPVCQRELPVVRDWSGTTGAEGVSVVGISGSFDPVRGNWPSTEWLEREDWTHPTLLDPDGAASAAAGQRSYPAFVAVDAEGNVAARVVGELGPAQLDVLAAAARG